MSFGSRIGPPKKASAAVAAAILLLSGTVILSRGSDAVDSGLPANDSPLVTSNSALTATATPTSPTSSEPATSAGNADVGGALAQLAQLAIKGRAPKTGYDRGLFGDPWTDDVNVAGGHNGCDTRNDVLRRDLHDINIKPSSNGCAVASGTLLDPYSGTTVPFVRGSESSADVQIDHLVALSDAWQKGAQAWDSSKRRDFANDPENLQATAGWLNQQKGDGDAATWLPPNGTYRCTYVSRIINVKNTYELWVTQAEHDAIFQILNACNTADPGRALTTPPERTTWLPAPIGPTTPEPTLSTPPALPVEPSPVFYANCRAAKAAGAAPIYAGQPGYRDALDGDGDGVACDN